MRRRVSSQVAFYFNVIHPLFCAAGMIVFSVVFWQIDCPAEQKLGILAWLVIIITVLTIGFFLVYLSGIWLKAVEMDGEWLYVWNFRKKMRVRLSDIQEVDRWLWDDRGPLRIQFLIRPHSGSASSFCHR